MHYSKGSLKWLLKESFLLEAVTHLTQKNKALWQKDIKVLLFIAINIGVNL